ncbi:hypothetical protein [Actinosynnema sp. NPDC020468]|uniref:pentapeptide repeat-containing protein n=1 Tax=Actinosynnema sp. NPDC020468 TaxID=3154488 RepID=UPI0033E14C44
MQATEPGDPRASPEASPVRYTVLSTRTIALWAALIPGVGAGVALWLLFGLPGPDAETTRLRLDSIRTAGTLVVGTGGAAALLLAARRQRGAEIDLTLKELANRTTDHDASERRVTESYSRAAEQLGSEKAPVRLAGLYALERLAQGNPAQRQTIVNVVCAYLRMPYEPPETPPDARAGTKAAVRHQERRQEREVRSTAQRVLRDHLRRDADPIADLHWPDIDVDLAGATLVDFDFDHCKVRTARFTGARFVGGSWFRWTGFSGVVDFRSAHFSGVAVFDGALFRHWPFLKGATFAHGLPRDLDELVVDHRPEPPATARPRPYATASARELQDKLDRLRRHAGLTMGDVATRSEHPPSTYFRANLTLTRETVVEILHHAVLEVRPEQLIRFLEVCGCPADDRSLWLVAWGRLVFAHEHGEDPSDADLLSPAGRAAEIEFEASRERFRSLLAGRGGPRRSR